jgi:hypothetical protein
MEASENSCEGTTTLALPALSRPARSSAAYKGKGKVVDVVKPAATLAQKNLSGQAKQVIQASLLYRPAVDSAHTLRCAMREK